MAGEPVPFVGGYEFKRGPAIGVVRLLPAPLLRTQSNEIMFMFLNEGNKESPKSQKDKIRHFSFEKTQIFVQLLNWNIAV